MRAAEHETKLNPAQWEALRYLARCNRFSNSPGALKDYLAATKGTISQTLKTLERKGLIEKASRSGDKRSVTLTLTAMGSKTLSWDPWQRLEIYVKEVAPEHRRALLTALRTLLGQEIARNQLKTFGICRRCRDFELNGCARDPSGPHRCGLFELPLSAGDAERICADHHPRDGRRAGQTKDAEPRSSVLEPEAPLREHELPPFRPRKALAAKPE